MEREAAANAPLMHLVPVVAGCWHTPQPGTVYTHLCLLASSGHAQPEDYPLDAMCVTCGQPIRREREFGCDWELKEEAEEAPEDDLPGAPKGGGWMEKGYGDED